MSFCQTFVAANKTTAIVLLPSFGHQPNGVPLAQNMALP
jgi:hypothetical protein